MSDTSHGDTSAMRIRPAVRRVAIVMCALLLPIAGHRAWDYVEVRRLVREIDAIRDKGEPVGERQALGATSLLPLGAQDAAAYYLAGAMLALGSRLDAMMPVREWTASPHANPESLRALALPLGELVQQSRDALSLADKAAALPFTAFPAGTEYNYRVAGLAALSELTIARTVVLAAAGDADGAVDSAISTLQARRALGDARGLAATGHQVALVLSLSRPSPEALRRLQAALAADDRPEQPVDNLRRARARHVDLLWRAYYGSDPNVPPAEFPPTGRPTDVLMRPWLTHRAVDMLRLWGELVEAAEAPWPEKAQRGLELIEASRTGTLAAARPGGYARALTSPLMAMSAFTQAVDPTALIVDRGSLVAVAIERFRRDRGSVPPTLSDLVPEYLVDVPEDPYSGRPLLFRASENGYTVYSVGPDRQDDGGDLSVEAGARGRAQAPRTVRSADAGIRVISGQDADPSRRPGA